MVEIGAGLGALTRPLLERAERVIAIERDRDLVPVLRAGASRRSSTGGALARRRSRRQSGRFRRPASWRPAPARDRRQFAVSDHRAAAREADRDRAGRRSRRGAGSARGRRAADGAAGRRELGRAQHFRASSIRARARARDPPRSILSSARRRLGGRGARAARVAGCRDRRLSARSCTRHLPSAGRSCETPGARSPRRRRSITQPKAPGSTSSPAAKCWRWPSSRAWQRRSSREPRRVRTRLGSCWSLCQPCWAASATNHRSWWRAQASEFSSAVRCKSARRSRSSSIAPARSRVFASTFPSRWRARSKSLGKSTARLPANAPHRARNPSASSRLAKPSRAKVSRASTRRSPFRPGDALGSWKVLVQRRRQGRHRSQSRRLRRRRPRARRRLRRYAVDGESSPHSRICNPHSRFVASSHHQRPARSCSCGSTARVQGSQPIERKPRSCRGLNGTSCSLM